jgi:hypothetical protein
VELRAETVGIDLLSAQAVSAPAPELRRHPTWHRPPPPSAGRCWQTSTCRQTANSIAGC